MLGAGAEPPLRPKNAEWGELPVTRGVVNVEPIARGGADGRP
jgi:hypothetical protein